MLYNERHHFAGLEYSSSSLARAKSVLPDNIELKQGSAVAIPFPSGFADMVTCIEVLEHIPDQYGALRDISRVMKPDATLMLSVPYRRWFPIYYTSMGHIRHYTREELQGVLDETGFVVMKWLPNYPRWHCFANYCYLTCRVLALMARIVGKRVYPHEIRLPFSEKKVIDVLFDRIEGIKDEEEKLDYAVRGTSTFVLCKKKSRLESRVKQ